MALSGMVIVAIFLLFSQAHGQFTPSARPSCNDPRSQAGSDYLPHETYCQTFYRCVSGIQYNMSCPEDLLFNPAMNICNRPEDSTCGPWTCNANNNGTKYPHVCNDKYYQCFSSAYLLMKCPTGQYFNMTTGNCGPGAPVYHELCPHYNSSNASGECHDFPSKYGDVCKYRTKTGNNTYEEDRPCPATLAFNETLCLCVNENTACPKPDTPSVNKRPDELCRASFRLEFDAINNQTGFPQAFSDKANSSLDITVKTKGAEIANGVATLSTDSATQEPAYLYVFHFNSNQLTPFIGFTIIFRAAAATTSPIQLFTTNYMKTCDATLVVNATYDGTTYSVSAFARGMTQYSVKNTTYAEETITSSVAVPTGSYVEVTFVYDLLLQLKLMNRGTTGTAKNQVVTRSGTKSLGTTLAYNKCGLTIAEGLTGVIDKVAVHEGCRNTTLIYNN